jgi:SNF2 family DNA or RNA helicase
MLHEEQIDLRRRRAREETFQIENVGKKKVFSEYRVSNLQSGGRYTVTVRGFDVGENYCTCPDFKVNTLGTCKHIERVLASLRDEATTIRQRRAVVARAEIHLHYRDQLRLRLQLPPRHSDQLGQLARRFFDNQGFWRGGDFDELVAAIEAAPEKVTVMSDALDFIDREIERRELARREREWLAELEAGGNTPLRHLLKAPLYDFQLHGALFMAARGRCILGDDMGLGKTVQAMAAVELLARERGVERVLVIAPASVKYQWEGEIRKFTERPVQLIEGLRPERDLLYAAPTFYRLVNYEQVVRDLDALNDWRPDVVVLDEAQRIRNWEAKTSRSVKKLRSRYALVLTGTPLENKLEELYSIVQFVDDRRLGPAFEFLHEHRVLDSRGNLSGYRQLDKLRDKLAPILLRRTRAEVLAQLPARTDNTLLVDMRAEQRAPYEEQRANLARLLRKSVLNDLDRKRILACLVNMRLLCDSTFLFDKATNVSPKLEEFAEVIEELFASGEHKAVIFSQWETMLHKAAEVLRDLGISYTLLHGGMAGAERKEVLERFKKAPDCRAFLSTDAGGVGLNLQTADTVINLELPWNPAVLEQRIARVHRMGQERPVRVINFVTRGSIEERVQKALETKRALFAGVFEGEGDEVNFAALGQTSFLDSVREAIGEEKPAPVAETKAADAAPKPDVLEAAVSFLEALAATDVELQWNSELRERAAAALGRLLERAAERSTSDAGDPGVQQ